MSKWVKVRERRFDHIKCWERSGLSQREYCQKARAERGVFYYWLKIFRGLPAEPSDPAFLPIVVQENVPMGADDRILLTCPNGLVVSFPNREGSIVLIRQLLIG